MDEQQAAVDAAEEAAAEEAAAEAIAEEIAEGTIEVVPFLFSSGVAHADSINQQLYDYHDTYPGLSFYSREVMETNPWLSLAQSDNHSTFDGSNHQFSDGITSSYQTDQYDLLFVSYDLMTPSQDVEVIQKWALIRGSNLNLHSHSSWQVYSEPQLGLTWHGGAYLYLYQYHSHEAEPIVVISDSADQQVALGDGAWENLALYHDHPVEPPAYPGFDSLRRVYYRDHVSLLGPA